MSDVCECGLEDSGEKYSELLISFFLRKGKNILSGLVHCCLVEWVMYTGYIWFKSDQYKLKRTSFIHSCQPKGRNNNKYFDDDEEEEEDGAIYTTVVPFQTEDKRSLSDLFIYLVGRLDDYTGYLWLDKST